MNSQIASTVRNVYFHLRRISKIRCHLNTATCAKVIHAIVTSRLDYHNGLLAGLSDKSLHSLQLAQNNAARLLTGNKRSDHIRPVLFQLHWLPIKQRIAFKVLTMMHKSIHDSNAPAYLREALTLYQPSRGLRSAADQWKLTVPRVYHQYGSCSFHVFGAKVWNTLPMNIRGPISVSVFKKQLKTILFKAAFLDLV